MHGLPFPALLFIGLALARLRSGQRADTKKQTKCNGEATVRRSFVLTQTPPSCCLLWCWLSSHQPNHRSQANELVRGLSVSVGGGREFFSFAEDRHTCTRNTQHQQRHKHKMTLEGLSDTRCFPHYHPSCTSSGTHHGRLTQLPPLLDLAMINRLSLPLHLPPLALIPLARACPLPRPQRWVLWLYHSSLASLSPPPAPLAVEAPRCDSQCHQKHRRAKP